RKTGSHLDVNQLPDALPEHLLAALEQERVKKRRIRDREYNRRSRQKKKQEKMAALAGSSHENIQYSQENTLDEREEQKKMKQKEYSRRSYEKKKMKASQQDLRSQGEIEYDKRKAEVAKKNKKIQQSRLSSHKHYFKKKAIKQLEESLLFDNRDPPDCSGSERNKMYLEGASSQALVREPINLRMTAFADLTYGDQGL
ncbi:hypothetical protein PMAYCL1PPCAC_28806, partial [Pristionchus mayeri]